MSNLSRGNAAPVTVEAKSLEQALVKAAGTLGASQNDISYEITREQKSGGLFSFFKNSQVQIKAWLGEANDGASSKKRGGAKRQAEAPKPQPLTETQIEDLTEELRDFCEGIVAQIAGEAAPVKAEIVDQRLILDIENDTIAQQFAKNAKLPEALEHVLRKKPRHLKQELPFRIFVDVGGVRRKREDELIQMAFDLSAKVSENRRPIVLNYKSSYDRKIIHMALDKDTRVYTKSIGSGPNRKLMILPTKGAETALEEEAAETHI